MWKIGLATRLFGKVDQVPGVCYVATEFFHVSYFPLVPIQTWVIFAGSETDVLIYESYRGIRIPRSWKSVLFAWIRAPLLVAALACPLIAWLAYHVTPRADTPPMSGFELLGWIVLGLFCLLLFTGTYWLSRAHGKRADELKRILAASDGVFIAGT